MIEQFKTQGNAEQDISDSYNEVVQRSGKALGLAGAGMKSMAATMCDSLISVARNIQVCMTSESHMDGCSPFSLSESVG